MENSSRIKDADHAREAIAQLRAGNPNKGARLAMAKAAVDVGNYTPEAKALWQAYADEGAPR